MINILASLIQHFFVLVATTSLILISLVAPSDRNKQPPITVPIVESPPGVLGENKVATNSPVPDKPTSESTASFRRVLPTSSPIAPPISLPSPVSKVPNYSPPTTQTLPNTQPQQAPTTQPPGNPVPNYGPNDLVQKFLIDQASRDAENKKVFDETVKRQEGCAAQRDAALAPIQSQIDSVKQQQAQLEADVNNMTGLSDAGKNRILAAEGLPLVQKFINLENELQQVYSQYGSCL